MRDATIIHLLHETGHLEHPFGERQEVDSGVRDSPTPMLEPAVIKAVASYHEFHVCHLDPLCLKHHSRPARCDGGVGPATHELFDMPRCNCPDYGESVQPATGTGSWKSCHNIGDFHAATYKVHKRGMPGFLEPIFDQILDQVVAAFDAMGLRLIRTEDDDANIDLRFETGRTNWIGLAQVASGLSCNSNLWCKYSARYQPANLVAAWIILLLHEFFHNCGGQHTRGGIMSPIIIPDLRPTWIGDPSEPIIRRLFGGEPVTPTPPDDPTGFPGHHITRITLPDGRFRDYDSIPRARARAKG